MTATSLAIVAVGLAVAVLVPQAIIRYDQWRWRRESKRQTDAMFAHMRERWHRLADEVKRREAGE